MKRECSKETLVIYHEIQDIAKQRGFKLSPEVAFRAAGYAASANHNARLTEEKALACIRLALQYTIEDCNSLLDDLKVEKPSKPKKFYVTYRIDARFTAEVEANTEEEAKEKSVSVWYEADFGQAKDVDGEIVSVEDEEGNVIYEL